MAHLLGITSEEASRALLASLTCGTCGKGFLANPKLVPCFRGLTTCADCFVRVNNLRMMLGLPTWEHPKGAYATEPTALPTYK